MSDDTSPKGFRGACRNAIDVVWPDGLPPRVYAGFDQALASCRDAGYSDIEATAMAIVAGINATALSDLTAAFDRAGVPAAKIVKTIVTLSAAVVVQVST